MDLDPLPLIPADRFEPHRRRLTELARLWLGSQADAEDAVQDAYLRLRDGLPESPGGEQAWLTTVVRHLCIDRLRRRALEQREAAATTSLHEHAPSAEHLAALSLDTQSALRRLVRRLRAEEVAAVLLHAVFDFDHAQLARLAGLTESASRQRVHRAWRRLREAEDDSPEGLDRDTDVLTSLCWRALRTHSPAALVALVSQPAVAASATSAPPFAATRVPARTTPRLLHVGGRFALGLELDGVMLCTLPLGPLGLHDSGVPAAA
ncbi:MAG TPA: sigma-70 family RNA polymerase sigma factor [Albitalea sp.]|nr:sigma-70 family RNA polymerase sigma factor [Albitalea sp.]